jgi:hypothetical protein
MHHIIIFCKCLIPEVHQSWKTFKIWSSSMLIGSLLCTRIFVTIILMKLTWLFHLCLSWLHDHNVHYGLGQPIHSSLGTLEACMNSFLKHTWGSNLARNMWKTLTPSDLNIKKTIISTPKFTNISITKLENRGIRFQRP